MALDQFSDRLHEQHSLVVKEEPSEESEVPVFCYESVTKQELILEDELTENEQSDDETSNGHPAGAPVNGDQYKHYKCPECHKPYKRMRRANSCQRKHEIIRLGLFECKVCQKRFANKHHLAGHENAHVRGTIKMFECKICCKRFSSKQFLENHEEIHSRELDSSVACEICPKRFTCESNLNRHMKTHVTSTNKLTPQTSKPSTKASHDNRRFQCSECNKKFDSLILLKRCFKKHEARRLGHFKCSFCGVALGTRHYLNIHEARHRNLEETFNNEQANLYQCQTCNMGFKQKGLLTKHVRTHTDFVEKFKLLVENDDGSFQCIECNKIFTDRRIANVHVSRHMRRKLGTFQCKTCNLQCPDRNTCSIHIQTHLTAGQTVPLDIREDQDNTQGSDMELEKDLGEPKPDVESKQFHIIEEIPESTVAKVEPQMMEVGTELSLNQSTSIEAGHDIEQLIPHNVMFGEFPS